MKRYEGMFLFDNTVAHEWAAIEQEVRRLMERIGANVLACVKFDERKLAYEIRGRKRGTYVLTYFEVDGDRIGDLERDARLTESVLRLLVLRTENLTEERLAQLRAHKADTPLSPLAGDGRRQDDYGQRDSRPPREDREARGGGEEGAWSDQEPAEVTQ
ncbi:MAG: 30S ribosomal protein S6 [Phycisphaerae bacterium]